MYELNWAAHSLNQTLMTTSHIWIFTGWADEKWLVFTQKFQLRCLAILVHAHTLLKHVGVIAPGIIAQVAISCRLPDITGGTAEAVRPDVLNAKYHVITSATYSCQNRDPVPAKFKHVTNIETCKLLCCDHFTLWKALDANMVEKGTRCSDKNVKILVRY